MRPFKRTLNIILKNLKANISNTVNQSLNIHTFVARLQASLCSSTLASTGWKLLFWLTVFLCISHFETLLVVGLFSNWWIAISSRLRTHHSQTIFVVRWLISMNPFILIIPLLKTREINQRTTKIVCEWWVRSRLEMAIHQLLAEWIFPFILIFNAFVEDYDREINQLQRTTMRIWEWFECQNGDKWQVASGKFELLGSKNLPGDV